jgi:hypothetical protein
LAEYLLNSNQKVRDVFRDVITIQMIMDENFEAIPLKDFISILQQINITLDTIDIYCIFTKLKYSDEYEAIDLNKLIEEMFNYGIFDTPFTKEESSSRPDIYTRLRRYLADRGLNFDSFMFNILSKISMQQYEGKVIRVISVSDFETYLRDQGVPGGEPLFSEDDKLAIVLPDNEMIDLQKVKELVEPGQTSTLNISDGKKKISLGDESLEFDKIDEGDIEGL